MYLNGSHLSPADFTATNGSDVVLAVAASADDVCDIISYTPFEIADQTFTGTTTMTDVVAASLDISGDIDIDGTTNLDIVDIDGAVNIATTALVTGVLTTTAATVFNGGFVANDGSTITTADNTTQLTLASTDTDANVGPVLDLFRNVTGATNDEIGRIQFTGKNDAGTDHTYANISSNIVDATSSGNTEDGSLVFQTIVAGSVRDRLNILSDQIVINQEGRDLDFRVESDGNANMLFVDGGNNRVGVGIGTPFSTFTINEPLDNGNALHLSNATGSSNGGSTNVIRSTGNGNAYWSNLQIHAEALAFKPQAGISVFIADSNGIVFNEESGAKDFRVESDGNANAFLVDASANRAMFGTSTTTGDTANSFLVVAGRFSTQNGTTSCANNTATTLMTFGSNEGNFLVSARLSGTGAVTDNTTGIVHVNNSAAGYTVLAAGSNVVLSVSGLALRVTQTAGSTLNLNWNVIRISL